MDTIDTRFDQLANEERRLLDVRTAASEGTGSLLLAIDLCCSALILLLAGILTWEGLRSRRQQVDLQWAAVSANKTLEAVVAERTEHLLVAHEKLRHSTSVLNSTFASMAEAVLVVDNEGGIVLANSAAERLLHHYPGMTSAQLLTENVTYKSDGLTRLATDEALTARILRGEQLDGLEIVMHRSGDYDPIQFVVSGRALMDASGTICGGALVFHDVTLARETECKLRQSQKLDAIGKLTGGVAHDFNNMLTVIGGTTEILVEKLHDRPDLRCVAALISQAADRCTELIQHLLAFARKQPLQPRNVDVNATVVDIGKMLRPTLGEQIDVESILEQEIASARVDPSQLANALINLAINARDAMPDGGKLVLETAGVTLDEAYAQSHTDVRPGAYVMLAVSDTGVGMSEELRDKVFEPFFTTKDTGKGTGLGLSMVYGFAKQSGGHVKIHSELGHGTTIRLYLPVAIGEPDANVPIAAPTGGAGETILVVEDDRLVREFVVAQLHSLGYRTVAAANGREALAYLESGRPFDLLFTDIVMPGGMTGRHLADEIIKSRPATKVLYTSGYTDNAMVDDGRLDRGLMLLSKPYRKSALARMIRLALGNGTVENLETRVIPLAGTSIVVPMRRLPAGGQGLSSG
jgi:PAS domain S-box-containing protein